MFTYVSYTTLCIYQRCVLLSCLGNVMIDRLIDYSSTSYARFLTYVRTRMFDQSNTHVPYTVYMNRTLLRISSTR